jgi:hypothetical protein
MFSVRNRFVSWVLVPAIVLAHLFCACAPAASASASHSDVNAVATHDCDDDGGDSPKAAITHQDEHDEHATSSAHHDDHSSPGGSQHSHPCKCASDVPVVTSGGERVSVPHAEPCPLPWATLAPSVTDLLSLASSRQSSQGSPWLTDPSPPPNHLLRVKCTLQI